MGKLTEFNYAQMEKRILYSLQNTEEDFYRKLAEIHGTTLITAVGGSMVVALFLAKVLELKNNVLCDVEEISRAFHRKFSFFENLIVVSASGSNHGVRQILKADFFHKYLITANTKALKDVDFIHYPVLDNEKSFVALSKTLIPITLLLRYYYPFDFVYQEKKINYEVIDFKKDYEVLYDYTSQATAHFLESTFIEAGISSLILHDKYSFCHGRSTLATKRSSILIYLLSKETDLDQVLLEHIHLNYEDILFLKTDYEDPILADYDLLLQAFSLVKELSSKTKRDLSNVKYSKIVSKIYHFKGEM